MTVPKNKRSVSKVEFFYYAYKLNNCITQVLLKDFGIKRINKDLKAFTYGAKMSGEDRESFMDICNRYDINVESRYPLWLLEYYREWILGLLRELINNITQANTIFPKNESEFYLRRKYQWEAISNCYQLLQAFQTAIRNLPVDVEKYMPYVKMIEEELHHLKNWKKSDNKILDAIKAKTKQ